jgi:FXSXX-COOH protein
MDETAGVESVLPDIAGLTVDELRALPGSVLAAALERLRTEAAESDQDQYIGWMAST